MNHIRSEIEQREREANRYSESAIQRKEASDIAYEDAIDSANDSRGEAAHQSCVSLRAIGKKLLHTKDYTASSGHRSSRNASISWKPNQYGVGVRIEHIQHGSIDFSLRSLGDIQNA